MEDLNTLSTIQLHQLAIKMGCTSHYQPILAELWRRHGARDTLTGEILSMVSPATRDNPDYVVFSTDEGIVVNNAGWWRAGQKIEIGEGPVKTIKCVAINLNTLFTEESCRGVEPLSMVRPLSFGGSRDMPVIGDEK